MLTTLSFDPSEELCDRIEAIIQQERDSHSTISWENISCQSLNPRWKVVIWKGDITTLKVDVIVNAANRYMIGCFTPDHACIDNVIHSWAGPRLRQECRIIMKEQGKLEDTGCAKITKGYCLPSKFVMHTVGPIARFPGDTQPHLLKKCYMSCLNLMKEKGLKTISFCCISTGVFGYPQEPAAKVALSTVKEWLEIGDNLDSIDRIVFNVFTMKDLIIYEDMAPHWFGE